MGEDRARVFRSTEDEQTTTPEPLSGIHPGSTPSASFGLSFACATNQINNLQQARQIV
jgi:hypothetical protein